MLVLLYIAEDLHHLALYKSTLYLTLGLNMSVEPMDTTSVSRASKADTRFKCFLNEIQQNMHPNSSELWLPIKKLRLERDKILKRRRTTQEKLKTIANDCKMLENDLEYAEKQIRDAEASYQSALMKEAQIGE